MKINKKKLLEWLNEKREDILNDLASNTTYTNQGKLEILNETIKYITSINKINKICVECNNKL